MKMILGNRPNQKKVHKILILERSSGKLYFPLHHLIQKFNVFFQMCQSALRLLHSHLLLQLKTETLATLGLSHFRLIFS